MAAQRPAIFRYEFPRRNSWPVSRCDRIHVLLQRVHGRRPGSEGYLRNWIYCFPLSGIRVTPLGSVKFHDRNSCSCFYGFVLVPCLFHVKFAAAINLLHKISLIDYT